MRNKENICCILLGKPATIIPLIHLLNFKGLLPVLEYNISITSDPQYIQRSNHAEARWSSRIK